MANRCCGLDSLQLSSAYKVRSSPVAPTSVSLQRTVLGRHVLLQTGNASTQIRTSWLTAAAVSSCHTSLPGSSSSTTNSAGSHTGELSTADHAKYFVEQASNAIAFESSRGYQNFQVSRSRCLTGVCCLAWYVETVCVEAVDNFTLRPV